MQSLPHLCGGLCVHIEEKENVIMKDIGRFRGCLIGGAVGDALGYAVEFQKENSIFKKYGNTGITEYELTGGVALISDDTQMTLFTANGLLLAATRGMAEDIDGYASCIALCYRDWLKTQNAYLLGFEPPEAAWLNNIPGMNDCRAPGVTCLQSLEQDRLGSVEDPINTSKGCGGVMRVAPIGLYFEKDGLTQDQMDMLGAEAAALTHGHALGYIPAAMLVHIVHVLAYDEAESVLEAVKSAKAAAARLFSRTEHLQQMLDLTDRAIALAADDETGELDAIHELGEGWVAEEALAIAIYCALKHEQDFEKAIIASVNHRGDSDSTGAVTGNILGARLGMKAIPEKYLQNLELKDTILEIADDLFHDCPNAGDEPERYEAWVRKYIDHTYPKG